VSERPQFFFELTNHDSTRLIYRLAWMTKTRVKIKGRETALTY